MKTRVIVLSSAVALLMSGGLAFASFERAERVEIQKGPMPVVFPEPEQVATNVLLRQILAEVIKSNSLKGDRRCSDGEKQYSPGYIISIDKKILRCDTGNGYPEWVEDKAR
ncbi:hypothetical protein AB2V43_004466 [Salmonella enterica]|nr:hypothetical protein [Salmonella enterica]